jgi:hypothetical protein
LHDCFGDIPVASGPPTEPPTEASAAERSSRLCICKCSILHAASPALLIADCEAGTTSVRERQYLCSEAGGLERFQPEELV